jgi:hypothetical protein
MFCDGPTRVGSAVARVQFTATAGLDQRRRMATT